MVDVPKTRGIRKPLPLRSEHNVLSVVVPIVYLCIVGAPCKICFVLLGVYYIMSRDSTSRRSLT